MGKKILLVAVVAFFGAVWAEDYFVGNAVKSFGDMVYLLAVRPCTPDFKNTYELEFGTMGAAMTFVVKKGDTFTVGKGFVTKDVTFSVANVSTNKVTLVKQ